MSQINVNTITGKDGGSAVSFPHGIIVTGVVTATSLNQTVNGNITATSFTGPLTGNVTGNVTGNCSGTAGSLAAGATGADLTLSGDLTVNGTTTTIDTAVTAVDSLAVDGSVGIGTTNPSGFFVNDLVVGDGGAANKGITVFSGNANVGYLLFADGKSGSERYKGQVAYNHSSNTMSILTYDNTDTLQLGTANAAKVTIDGNGTTKFKGPLTEKCHYDTGGGLQSDYHHDLITHGNVYWSDTAAAGAFTFNLRGSATVALNDMMSTGESLSFWFAHACHSDTTRYMTAFKVDGNTISGGNIIWSGGSAPTSAGGGSGTKDVYTFTVFKAGDAFFRAFAAQTNHT